MRFANYPFSRLKIMKKGSLRGNLTDALALQDIAFSRNIVYTERYMKL